MSFKLYSFRRSATSGHRRSIAAALACVVSGIAAFSGNASAAPVNYIASSNGVNTATLPSHQAGDVFIAWAIRDGSNNAPALPAGWTAIASNGVNSLGYVAAWKQAASGSETAGTFTNATSVIVSQYRAGTGYAVSVGAYGSKSSSSATTSVTYPGLTLEKTDGTSVVVALLGHRSPDISTLATGPSGTTNRSIAQDSVDSAAAYDTGAGVSAWTQRNAAIAGTAGAYRTFALELKADAAASSTPLPQSVSNTSLTHKSQITLTGQAFGTRAVPVSRLVFDDASGTSVTDKWDFSCNSGAQANYRMAYRTPSQVVKANGVVGGVATPHSRITKYVSGAPYTASGGSWNVCLGKNNQQDQKYTYISFYTRIDPSFHFNCTTAGGSDPECDRNYKEYDWAKGNGYMGDNGSNIYAGIMWAATGNNSVSWGFNNGEYNSGSLPFYGDLLNLDVHEYYPEYQTAPTKVYSNGPINGWIKVEMVLKHEDVMGLERMLVDNDLMFDMWLDNRSTTSTPTARSETVVGGYHRDAGSSELYKNNFRYYSQIYYDRSWARVVLANNANYDLATIVEPQVLTSWTNSNIGFTTNLGRLSAGTTAYLFVFNENGVRSEIGVPVVVGQ